MFKPVGILFCCALLFVAGCATQSVPPSEVISESGPLEMSSLNWTNPAATNLFPPAPVQPVVPPVRAVTPPVVVPIPAQTAPPLLTTWTSLAGWAAAQGLAAPRKSSSQPAAEYSVSSRYGTMVLAIGSREATWNGVVINLGFAPEIIDGEVWLHGLDLEKKLEPLLCEPPLAFPETNRVIVIDPGHGGNNHGTYVRSAQDGPFEKEFTLDWALRLKPLLEAEGWTVLMTRTSDVMVSNYDRVTFAEEQHADLFISLHFNSTELDRSGKRNESSNGIETYCLTPTGMPSTITRGAADPWYENLPNNKFDAQNLELAILVQSALLRATGLDDRGVRCTRYDTVLRGQNRPAILVEGGYLSNPREAALIETAAYRQKLAEAMADVLK